MHVYSQFILDVLQQWQGLKIPRMRIATAFLISIKFYRDENGPHATALAACYTLPRPETISLFTFRTVMPSPVYRQTREVSDN